MPTSASKTTEPEARHESNGHAPADYRKLFEALGLEITGTDGVELIAQCPWCSKPKFYVNSQTSEYLCQRCGTKGNHLEFLRHVYTEAFGATTDEQYQGLRKRRGIPLQTLKRHGLAFSSASGEWFIPFKSRKGEALNLQRYSEQSGRKLNLPCLPVQLYGLDRLSDDVKRHVFLCEGAFDAIALDFHLTNKKIKRHDILAVPGSGTFKDSWREHFRNRTVRILFDNDDAGRDGSAKVAQSLIDGERIAAQVYQLRWPKRFADKYDISDFVRDLPDVSIPEFVREHSVEHVANRRLQLRRASQVKDVKTQVEWLWPQRIPCGSYVTFFGYRGTYKSTIARDLAARVTSSGEMPDGRKGLGASGVIYFTSEDDENRVIDDVRRYGGDDNRLWVHELLAKDGKQVNLLDELDELQSFVAENNVKLIVVDAQNSFVGAPDISTDMKGRHFVSNRLHRFAQKSGVSLIGIRNTAENDSRALGSQSMSDISRCIFRTQLVKTDLALVFDKVNDAPTSKHRRIEFHVVNEGEHRRRIVWGKAGPSVVPKTVAKKGSEA